MADAQRSDTGREKKENMSMRATISAIKADTGSPGGHTKPSEQMFAIAKQMVEEEIKRGFLLDGRVTYTGDDLCLTMIHTHGSANEAVHQFAWRTFLETTGVAKAEGLYGAGQDLLVDAPSGNIRGAGPGVAEISFELLPSHRPAETFMVWTGDKCAPGMFNLPLYLNFADPMHNGGLLLSPDLYKGFSVTVIDMNHSAADRVTEIQLPEEHLLLAAALRNPDRFAIEAIHSRAYPDEQIVSVAATRLHNVKGVYTGKDDPCAIIRTQRIFPAPEEILEPWLTIDQIITGDCRGSHNMPIMPAPINTAVTGPYCFPIISALGYSLNGEGKLSEAIDFFDNPIWDSVRTRVQEKGADIRRQGFFGVAMASQEEQAYTGLKERDSELEERFRVRTETKLATATGSRNGRRNGH
jgi:fructose 1,6-bisphosphate aldolase/phosphatase